MIKFPIKDCDTLPWMSKKEIPVIKAILSAWRERRRDWKVYGVCMPGNLNAAEAQKRAMGIAYDCEVVSTIQEMLEAEKCAKH